MSPIAQPLRQRLHRMRARPPFLDASVPLEIRLAKATNFLSAHECRLRRRLASLTDAETPLDPDADDLWRESRLRFLRAVRRADAQVEGHTECARELASIQLFLGIANEVARDMARDRRENCLGFHTFRLGLRAQDEDALEQDASRRAIPSVADYLDYTIARAFANGRSHQQVAREVGIDAETIRTRWSQLKTRVRSAAN